MFSSSIPSSFVFRNTVKKLMLCNYNVPRYSDEMGSASSGNFQLALHLSKFRINIRIVGSSIPFQLFAPDNPIRSHSRIQSARIKYQAIMVALIVPSFFFFIIHIAPRFLRSFHERAFSWTHNTHAKYIYVHVTKSWYAHIRTSVTRSNCARLHLSVPRDI